MGAGARGARARAPPSPAPLGSARGPPPLQSRRPPSWPAPLPPLPGAADGRGERAGAAAGVRETPEKRIVLLLASARSALPAAPGRNSSRSPSGRPGREALRARACPGGRSGRAPQRSSGPRPLYRASKETDWPPGGNLSARRSERGFVCSPKTIANSLDSGWDLARLPWEGAPRRRRRPLPGRAALAARFPGIAPARGARVPTPVTGPGPRKPGTNKDARCPLLQLSGCPRPSP